MEFTEVLDIVGDEPVFETGLLLAGDVEPADVRRQLSRWTSAGRLFQLRRGVYALAPPHQKVKPHPFVIANALVRGSYVSRQAALAHYGTIPDLTPVTTSVTTARPGRWETPLGLYDFRHAGKGAAGLGLPAARRRRARLPGSTALAGPRPARPGAPGSPGRGERQPQITAGRAIHRDPGPG